jgi:hypothetical protein
MSRTSQTNQFESGIVMQRVRGCELFATGSSFLDLVKVRNDFLAPLFGGEMNLSTFLVLLALTAGQGAVLSLGILVLWLAGEFGGGHE